MTAVLEEKIAHLEKTVDELSDVVRAHGGEIAVLTRQVSALMARERERGSEGGGGIILGDERPPHY